MVIDMVVGPIFFLLSKKNQSVGDRVASTLVIRKKNVSMDISDIPTSTSRKVFATLFVLALVVIVTMSIVTIPKIKYLNDDAVSMIKDAQSKVSTNDINGLYQLFVPQFRDQVSLDKFKESISSDKFLELIAALNADNIKFYNWSFDDKDMFIQGVDRSSSVKIAMDKQVDGSWKLVSLAINNPEIENKNEGTYNGSEELTKFGLSIQKPMFGALSYDDYVSRRGDAIKSSDESYIAEVTKTDKPDEAIKKLIQSGWEFVGKKEADTAMEKFNQAWLLDYENFNVYWGYAAVLGYQGNLDDSSIYFDKALTLYSKDKIVVNGYLPLWRDASLTFINLSDKYLSTDTKKADLYASKAIKLLSDSLKEKTIYQKS